MGCFVFSMPRSEHVFVLSVGRRDNKEIYQDSGFLCRVERVEALIEICDAAPI